VKSQGGEVQVLEEGSEAADCGDGVYEDERAGRRVEEEQRIEVEVLRFVRLIVYHDICLVNEPFLCRRTLLALP